MGPFQCNCRLLACDRTGQAVLVDPGDEPAKILKAIEGTRTPSGALVQVKFLFHTHGHLDHIGATRKIKQSLTAKSAENSPQICLHKGDEDLYLKLSFQGQIFGMTFDEPLPIDRYFEDEEVIDVGDLKFNVLHTPGHSPGSVSLRLHENRSSGIPETVFSGDTLFQGSVGRTDLWGANQDQMFKSIRTRLLSLDEDTRVCPGHGPESTIGIEKRENPFL